MKYLIWIKEDCVWVEQGDGPLTRKTADRIVSELRHDFGGCYRILPVGRTPDDFGGVLRVTPPGFLSSASQLGSHQ